MVPVTTRLRQKVAGFWYRVLMKGGSVRDLPPHTVAVLPYGPDSLTEQIVVQLQRAIELLEKCDPPIASAVGRRIKTIIVTNRVDAQVIPEARLALIGRAGVECLGTEQLAGQLVFLAAYARVLRRIQETPRNAKRIECVSRRAELFFLGHVPGTIDLRLRLEKEASELDCGDRRT